MHADTYVKTSYKQCQLVKDVPGGTATEMAWIPITFAVKGSVINIQRPSKEWDCGWTVFTVYEQTITQAEAKVLSDRHRDFEIVV